MFINGQPISNEAITELALTNYGCFTTMLVTDSGIRGLSLHVERLQRDSQLLFGTNMDEAKIRQYVLQAVDGQKLPIIVRLTLFCKDFDMGHPNKTFKPDALVITRPVHPDDQTAVSLHPLRFLRVMPEIKSTAIGPAFYQRRLAQQAGYDDALFVTDQDEIAEGPTWNIGFVQEGTIVLPDGPSLEGVSMQILRGAAEKAGMSVAVKTVTLDELSTMQAAFISNAPMGVKPVSKIAGQTFPDHDLFEKLRTLYQAAPCDAL